MKVWMIGIAILGFLMEEVKGLPFEHPSRFQSDTLTVRVLGTESDARFEPAIVQVSPGDVIRFEVLEGIHTVTAYHPDNRRPLRMPANAEPFDSGPLTIGDVWELTLEVKGVYDYFCLPHEQMGHAGRIITGDVADMPAYDDSRLPEAVRNRLNLQGAND
ncbi:MAG: plastocyanin/azurin family copper-binding protein [Balneolaceae bacterium]